MPPTLLTRLRSRLIRHPLHPHKKPANSALNGSLSRRVTTSELPSSVQNFSASLRCGKSTTTSHRRQTLPTSALHPRMIHRVLVRLRLRCLIPTLIPLAGPIGFAGRLSLAFLVPLLESQATTDPALCSITVKAALGFIKDCPIASLHAEPAEYIDALEHLLESWLDQASHSSPIPAPADQIAAARVALACAR